MHGQVGQLAARVSVAPAPFEETLTFASARVPLLRIRQRAGSSVAEVSLARDGESLAALEFQVASVGKRLAKAVDMQRKSRSSRVSSKRQAQHGFTLVEILVVLCIIGLIMGGVAMVSGNAMVETRKQVARD